MFQLKKGQEAFTPVEGVLAGRKFAVLPSRKTRLFQTLVEKPGERPVVAAVRNEDASHKADALRPPF